MRAGDLRHRIIIQTNTPTKDTHGGEVDSWATASTVWAKVTTLTGRKLEIARQINIEANVEVTIRYCSASTLTVANRFLFGARIFEPVYIVNANERDIFQIAVCKEQIDV